MILDLGRWALLASMAGMNYLPTHFIVGNNPSPQPLTSGAGAVATSTLAYASIIAPILTSSFNISMQDPATITSGLISITATLNLPLNSYSGSSIIGTELALVHLSSTSLYTTPQPISYSALVSQGGIATNPNTMSSSFVSVFAYTPLTGTYNIFPSSTVTFTWLWVFSINLV